MCPESEERLIIQQATLGDREAVGRLYERYVDAVYRYMFYRTGDHHVAEDLTAEVFTSLITSIKNYEDLGLPFEAWLFRIAHARLIDYRRKSSRGRQKEIALSEEAEEFLIGEAPEDKFKHEEVMNALQYLTTAEREVIVLRFAAGLDNQEIAMAVQSNTNAIKSMTHRALKKMRKILQHRALAGRSRHDGK
jgi:RNA polymerase sigma-70 factor (ECF subfamily)